MKDADKAATAVKALSKILGEHDAAYSARAIKCHDGLVAACRELIKANQHVRDLSLNRDEAHRGMIWGEARSLLDTAKLKGQQVIAKATR